MIACRGGVSRTASPISTVGMMNSIGYAILQITVNGEMRPIGDA